MKKWVGPGSRPLAVKDPIGNPLTVSGTTSFSPSLAISTFSSFHLPRYSFHFSLSFFQFIVSDYLGFFFFFFEGEEQLVQSQWIDPFVLGPGFGKPYSSFYLCWVLIFFSRSLNCLFIINVGGSVRNVQ